MHVFQVHFTMRLTYETFARDDDDTIQGLDAESPENGGSPRGDIHTRSQWDEDCPWSEWYSAEEPFKGVFEQIICSFTLLLYFCSSFNLWRSNLAGLVAQVISVERWL